MLENRRHMRIREIFDIRWAVLGTDDSGEGKIHNISTSGLSFQTDGKFNPKNLGEVFIDAHGQDSLAFGSKKGKIVWMRRMPEGRPGYQCGIEFTKNSFDKQLNGWLDLKTSELAQAMDANILNHYIF
jgi:hypothetical protein